MTSSEEPSDHGKEVDVPDVVIRTAMEVMRRGQAGMYSETECAIQVLKLQRAAVLSSKQRLQVACYLRELLETHMTDQRHIIEGVTARVMDAVAFHGQVRTKLEAALDTLVDQVTDSVEEIGEHAAAALIPYEPLHVVVVADGDEASPVERALVNAADMTAESESRLCVSVVRINPDESGTADSMMRRLSAVKGLEVKVIDDSETTKVLRHGGKILLNGVALDIDEGVLCSAGSAILCSVATRMRIPVLVTLSKFRMLPLGGTAFIGLSAMQRYPGKVWDYDSSRNDRHHDSVGIVASTYDVLPLMKIDMIVTEGGGFSPEYAVNMLPAADRNIE